MAAVLLIVDAALRSDTSRRATVGVVPDSGSFDSRWAPCAP